MLPDPTEQATMTLDEVARALRISRTSAYEGARNGEIPVIRVGRRLLAPTAAIRRMCQLDEPHPVA